jgi:hypothetical protein
MIALFFLTTTTVLQLTTVILFLVASYDLYMVN